MYATSNPSNELFTILFFTGWDRRVHDQSGEEIECRLSQDNISFKWIHVRQMWKWVWIRKEHNDDDGMNSPIISLDVLKNGEFFRTLSMEENWTLIEVREQLELCEDFDHFVFVHNGKMVMKR